MAFREQEYKERCNICGEEADEHCPRCRQNTCKEHRAEDLLCQACEQEYVDHKRTTLKEDDIASKARRTVHMLFGAALFVIGPVSVGSIRWLQEEDRYAPFAFVVCIVVFPLFFLLHRRLEQRLKARLLVCERKRLRVRFISPNHRG